MSYIFITLGHNFYVHNVSLNIVNQLDIAHVYSRKNLKITPKMKFIFGVFDMDN